MDKILISLINSFIKGSGEMLNNILVGLTEKIFYAEVAFTQSIGSTTIMDFDKVYQLFLDFAISLIILKFLKKGFDIYIGWYSVIIGLNQKSLILQGFADLVLFFYAFS